MRSAFNDADAREHYMRKFNGSMASDGSKSFLIKHQDSVRCGFSLVSRNVGVIHVVVIHARIYDTLG